jgi:hypothetical protein
MTRSQTDRDTSSGHPFPARVTVPNTSGFRIAEESSETVRNEVVAVLSATRSSCVDPDRFVWLYERNPDGPAVVWSIRETGTAKMVGFTAALPRRMVVAGETKVCWIGSDFSILPKFRTLGLALKLRRAAKEGVDRGEVDFLYSHPNERMAVVHARVGHRLVGRMVRYARPLRLSPYLQERFPFAVLGSMAGMVADPLLRLMDVDVRHRFHFQTRVVRSPVFDERFDRLFDENKHIRRVVGVRDARHLSWRYAENPLYHTDAILAEEGGQLRGYLLMTESEGFASIKDLFPAAEDVASDLLMAAIREGRARGWKGLSFTVLESNPLLRVLERCGFRQRSETSEMYAYGRPESPMSEAVVDAQGWYLTVGDRDV